MTLKAILFHNDVWGLLFYIAIAVLTAFLVIGVDPLIWWENLMKISVAVGTLFSIFLIYLQWKVIKAWCFWCVLSAITIFGMAIILIMFAALPRFSRLGF